MKNEEEKKKEKYRFSICGIVGVVSSVVALIFVCCAFVYLYLSVVALIFSLLAIIVGSIGVHLSRLNKKEGKDYSSFGMSLGVIILIPSIILTIIFLTIVL